MNLDKINFTLLLVKNKPFLFKNKVEESCSGNWQVMYGKIVVYCLLAQPFINELLRREFREKILGEN